MEGISAIEARISEIRQRFAPPVASTGEFAGVLASALARSASALGRPRPATPDVPQAASRPAAVDAWIDAAIVRTGVPSSWAAALRTIAQHESGFDPNAYNGNDRTRDGRRQTVIGLMQMLPSTFAAHTTPAEGDIFDPVDNMSAAIRYIRDRYGEPANTPGLRALARGAPYRGY